MAKIGLDPNNRIVYYENSDQIEAIRAKIRQRIEAELQAEAGDLRKVNDELYAKEREFRKEVWQHIVQAHKNGSRVQVETQTGRGGTLIRKYVGHVSKLYGSDCFNMLQEKDSKSDMRGEFTIGSSCLLSFEIL